MARNLVQLMDEEEFEDPLAGSGLDMPEPMDDAAPTLTRDDIQLEPDAEPETGATGWDELLKPATAQTPEAGPAAPISARKPVSAKSLDATWDADELKTAQKKDRKSAHLDSASDALYAAFARRPIQKISNTPSQEDSVLKQFSLKRQGAMDERQLGRDAAADKLAQDKLSQPKGRSGSEAQDELMRLRAEKLKKELGAPDDSEAEAEDLEAFRMEMSTILGKDLSKMSPKSIAALAKQLGLEKTLKDRAAGRAAKAKAAEDKAGKKADAAGDANYLEGYELLPEAAPQKIEVRDMRAAQASTRTIGETIDEIEKLYKTHGTAVLPGAARARMEALVTDLQMAMKGQEQYALGVLAGPDMGLLEKTVSNPTGSNASLLDFFSGDTNVLERYQALRGQSRRRFENKARSMGFRLKGSGPVRQPMPGGELADPKPASGLAPDKAARLAELRRKRDAGQLK